MKRQLTVLSVLLLIIVLCALCLSSCTNGIRVSRSGVYLYTAENEEVTITGYVGVSADVTIPESINGMPVVAIGINAFDSTMIKSLTIPDSVVKIDSLAFDNCYFLERVTLGCGIREISFYAFSDCDNMIYNEYENGNYIGNAENPYMALVCTLSTDIETLTIHPDTVIVCGTALKNCCNLSELVFPEGMVSICNSALENCLSLETVYIPKSVELIDRFAFEGCNSIREIIVSNDNSHFKSVNGSLFSRDGSSLIKYAVGQEVDSYRIPDDTVTIENSAFENAMHLTDVTFPDSVETIGSFAFINCENLRSIHFGNALKSIDGQAFGFCTSLTEITIPDSVEELSHSAFSYCDKLESAVIGSGVIHLECDVFQGCDNLSKVVFRDSSGWQVKTAYSIRSDKVDLSDPMQNANFLTDEYCGYYWNKKTNS